MKKQITLDLHPAWDRTLSAEQKQRLQHHVPMFQDSIHSFDMSCYHHNRRKDGGFVLTLLLCNHTDQPLPLNQIKIAITNEEHTVKMDGEFSLDMMLKPYTVKPWSFIFTPEQTSICHEQPTEGMVTFLMDSLHPPIQYQQNIMISS